MSTRNLGLVETILPPQTTIASVAATTSGGVAIVSVNTTGAQYFTLVNFGSTPIYVDASFDGSFYNGSVAMIRVTDAASVNSIAASAAAQFSGPYQAVRIYANSGSGVYRAQLIYR